MPDLNKGLAERVEVFTRATSDALQKAVGEVLDARNPWQLLYRLSRIVLLGLVLYTAWLLITLQPDLAKRMSTTHLQTLQEQVSAHQSQVHSLLRSAIETGGDGLHTLALLQWDGGSGTAAAARPCWRLPVGLASRGSLPSRSCCLGWRWPGPWAISPLASAPVSSRLCCCHPAIQASAKGNSGGVRRNRPESPPRAWALGCQGLLCGDDGVGFAKAHQSHRSASRIEGSSVLETAPSPWRLHHKPQDLPHDLQYLFQPVVAEGAHGMGPGTPGLPIEGLDLVAQHEAVGLRLV